MDDLLEIEDHRRELEVDLAGLLKKIEETTMLVERRKIEIRELQNQQKLVNSEEESKAVDDKLAYAHMQFDRDTRELQDLEFEKEVQTENIAILKTEEEEIGKSLNVEMMPGAEEFRQVAQQIFQKIRVISTMKFFVPTKDCGRVLSFLEWDAKQKECREQAKSHLGTHIRSIASTANNTVFYKNNASGWKRFVNRIEVKVIDALVRAFSTALQEISNAVHGYAQELFIVTLRLNQNHKLSFSPLITDVGNVVNNLCQGVLGCLKGMDRVYNGINLKPELIQEISADYFTHVVGNKEVQNLLSRIDNVCRTLPDRVVEYVCALEDEYKCIWANDSSSIGSWKENGKFLLYQSKLQFQWEHHVHLDTILIDSKPLHDTLTKMLNETYTTWKEKNPPFDEDADPMADEDDDDDEDLSAYYKNVLMNGVSAATPSSGANKYASSNGMASSNNTYRNTTTQKEKEIPAPTPGSYAAGSAAALARQTGSSSSNTAVNGSSNNNYNTASSPPSSYPTNSSANAPNPRSSMNMNSAGGRVSPTEGVASPTASISPPPSSSPLAHHGPSSYPRPGSGRTTGPTSVSGPPAPTDVERRETTTPSGHVAGSGVAALRSSGSGLMGARPVSPKETTNITSPSASAGVLGMAGVERREPPPPLSHSNINSSQTPSSTYQQASSSAATSDRHHSPVNSNPTATLTFPPATSPPAGTGMTPTAVNTINSTRSPSGSITQSATRAGGASNAYPTTGAGGTASASPYNPTPTSAHTPTIGSTNITSPTVSSTITPHDTLPPVSGAARPSSRQGTASTSGPPPSSGSQGLGGFGLVGSPGSVGGSPGANPDMMLTDKSLYSVYRYHCTKNKIKPNSGLLKMLPKEEGVYISEINMDYNYIGVKGLQPLLEILKLNRNLKVLNLKDNNLENNEIKALVNVLIASEDTLQTLDLSNNPISLHGGSALIELITKKRNVTEVRLDGTLIQQKIIAKISELVAQNKANTTR
eukprot:TRINITY_DN60251_c0_g1_i1.p1 TRINITY_DN60251_c0_g1~~TRINITY_DN60251_c0_g1_i1.p1  ORF type:complete len:989 (+),score=104.14 TRINITY_DN60251_c0_g1_i1:84-3050(+)